MLLIEKNVFCSPLGYHHVDIAKEHWKYLGFPGVVATTYLLFFSVCLLYIYEVGPPLSGLLET